MGKCPFLSLQAAPGRGANGGKEGFCMELSSPNNSKQLIVKGIWAFLEGLLFLQSPVSML